ncbi:MAG: hypothetical protein NZM06_01925 [Chloroherpetonaceae bacterium]|nr:hypothetical protein [Chloroherpetonaceae bacterium]MDW8437177.1 hypothetical protein [Chloroherpetonaceae bacterium]
MKRIAKLPLFLASLACAMLLSAARTSESAAWSDWIPIKDGHQNLLSYRYQHLSDRAMQFEIKNDYDQDARFYLEINTRWDWLPYGKEVDYVYGSFKVDARQIFTQPIRGSEIIGVKVKNLVLKETVNPPL